MMCDNCGRSSMAGNLPLIGGEQENDINVTLAEKDAFIREQRDTITQLKRELDAVVSDRDLLLCEVSNLRFELEMIELKRLQDESFPQKTDRSAISASLTTSYTQEQTYITAQNYIQGQNYLPPTYSQTPDFQRNSAAGSASCNQQQSLHKKGMLRSGDILKRTRVQTMYELSQDLLDKQIEVLERKYGGVKARTAALTIQRAFRRYTLLKKFAAITAMAKAEKRISRKIPNSIDTDNMQNAPANPVEGDHNADHSYVKTYDSSDQEYVSSGPSRPLPVRSLSLRERRNVKNIHLPRSQSGSNNLFWEGYVSYQGPSHGNPGPHSAHHNMHCYNAPNNSGGAEPGQTYDCPSTSTGGSNKGQQSSSPLWIRADSSQTVASGGGSSPGSSSTGGGYSRSRNSSQSRKVPPEVPKRTSSISNKSIEPRPHRSNGLNKKTENGSLSSVQSSGSDSSISTDKLGCDGSERYSSSVWKRQGGHGEYSEAAPETSLNMISHTSGSEYTLDQPLQAPATYKMSETVRKRQYRVGLNLFNKKPERGIYYLIRRGFLENSPQGVARFLISRKGLSKQMIGEYLGNLQSTFCMAVLECFARELDLSGMQIDVALRKFQAYFRMPGEAQKIERLMEIFSHRYCECNLDIVARLRSPDTVFVLSFAIIMLNTDLHTPNLKPERRMRMDDFIKNLRGIDDCGDIDSDMLAGIYDRVKANEFKPGSDHVSQVMKVQTTIVGKKPNLALPHRRLVCYCRLYEIPDVNKKERPGVHQREVFLFNDLLIITKILSKKKSSVTYTFRNSFPLCGMVVTLFESAYYSYGIKLSQKVDGKLLIVFNARNEHDRYKFAEDLRESVSEMDEMENLRIEAELDRQKSNRGGNRSGTENRDSGVADVEVCACPCGGQNMNMRSSDGREESNIDMDAIHNHTGNGSDPSLQFKRSALSNSLLDIHDQFAGEKSTSNSSQRRGSVGSLDSGMSVSFQPVVPNSNCTRNNNEKSTPNSTLNRVAYGGAAASGAANGQKSKHFQHQQQQAAILKRDQRHPTSTRSDDPSPVVKFTEV